MKTRYEKLEFDELQMYFGEPLRIDEQDTVGVITVYEPTIGDVVHIGENKFFETLSIFTNNTTSCRLLLWDCGQDWNVVTDFELFCSMYRAIDPDVSELIFKDLDWSKFEVYEKMISEDKKVVVLYDAEDDIEINERIYQIIHQYLQAVFNLHPEEKITKSEHLKKWYIDSDRRKLNNAEYKKEKGEKTSQSIRSVISACVNHPGFKYKTSELRQVPVCEFYDSVQRLQVYEHSTALLKGMFSGFVDTKKIKPETYNFMRNLDRE